MRIESSAPASQRLQAASAAALMGLLAFALLTPWVEGRWALSVYQAGVFVLGMIWCAGACLRGLPVRVHGLLIPLGGAVGWALVQLACGSTVYRWDTWNALLQWGMNLALFFVALQVFADSGLRDRFLESLLYFTGALSIVATLQTFTSQGKVFWLFPSGYTDFVMGPFVYRNHYAAFIELVLPLAVMGAVRKARNAWICAILAASMIASVIACASRTGTVLVIAETGFLIATVALRRGVEWKSLAGACARIALLVPVFVSVIGFDTLWKRFQVPDPFGERLEMTQASFDMVRDRPWLGFGLGAWPRVYPAYARTDDGLFANQAHDDWAQWAAEGGIPFLLLMLAIAGWAVAAAPRRPLAAGLVAVLVHALIDYPMQKPSLSALFFTLAGLIAAQDRPRMNADEQG
jgi:O-antigen ligase